MSALASLLAFGFAMGVRHALEADHVAAVASLATRERSMRARARLAAVWGCGHAAVLIALAGALFALERTVPATLAQAFEAVAGLVLVALGVDVLRRWRRADAGAASHVHGGPATFGRALLVGSLHGLAGSGALVLLALQAAGSPPEALAYVVVFGAGSVLGMVLFSLVVALPFSSRASLGWMSRGFEGAVGLASVAIGGWMAASASLQL